MSALCRYASNTHSRRAAHSAAPHFETPFGFEVGGGGWTDLPQSRILERRFVLGCVVVGARICCRAAFWNAVPFWMGGAGWTDSSQGRILERCSVLDG